jgi:hypothetical protein
MIENEEHDSDDMIKEQDIVDKIITKDHFRMVKKIQIENIQMLLNDRGYIYYITN